MTSLELFFFGHPRILRDGRPVGLPRRRLTALLAYLAVTGQPQPRTVLAALLWPESARALANLRRHLSELKAALGEEWLAIDRATIGLAERPGLWIDVRAFQDHLVGIRMGPSAETLAPLAASVPVPAAALPSLTAAADLQPGDFLAGFTLRASQTFDDWQRDQAEFLRRRLTQTLRTLVHGLAQHGDLETALPYARRWAALDPLEEAAHLALMQLYAATGQLTAGLHQYERCAEILAEELAVEPAPELTALRGELIEVRADPAALPVRSPARLRPHHLPAPPTPFIGREAALAELDRLLREPGTRLITILGPGGSGKTRLAIQAARQQLEAGETPFQQGVFFVPLAALKDFSRISDQFAGALRLSPQEGQAPQDQVFQYLRDKSLLLVVDNFEQVLAGAPFVAEVLSQAPGVKFLTTSRRRLNLQAETIFAPAGMPVPDWDLPPGEAAPTGTEAFSEASESAAVQLFINTARRSQPSFELTPADLVDVARLCRLVDGMPLAIELAAGWVPHLPLESIAAEIDRHYSILETELADVDPRHRSMQAVFEASWALLHPAEKDHLAQLAVFETPFSREAAVQVAGAGLQQLARFTNASLLLPTGDGLYQFHNLQRQYARERLAETPPREHEARARHCIYFASHLTELGAGLRGTRQAAALQALDRLFPDLQTAWDWAVEVHELAALENLMDGLWYFFHIRARFAEALALFTTAAARLPAVDPRDVQRVAHKVQIFQAYFATVMGDWDTGLEVSSTVAAQLRSEGRLQDVGVAGAFLALTRMALDDTISGQELGLESLGHARRAGDAWGLATTLNILGGAHAMLGADDEAEAFLQESAAWYRKTADRWGLAHCIYYLGVVARGREAYAEARKLFEECLEISRALGDPVKSLQSLLMLGQLYDSLAAPGSSQRAFQEGLDLARQLGDRRAQTTALAGLCSLTALRGDSALARTLLQEALSLEQDAEALAPASRGMVALAAQARAVHPQLAWQLVRFILESGLAPLEVLRTAEGLQRDLERRYPEPAWALPAGKSIREALLQALKDDQP